MNACPKCGGGLVVELGDSANYDKYEDLVCVTCGYRTSNHEENQ